MNGLIPPKPIECNISPKRSIGSDENNEETYSDDDVSSTFSEYYDDSDPEFIIDDNQNLSSKTSQIKQINDKVSRDDFRDRLLQFERQIDHFFPILPSPIIPRFLFNSGNPRSNKQLRDLNEVVLFTLGIKFIADKIASFLTIGDYINFRRTTRVVYLSILYHPDHKKLVEILLRHAKLDFLLTLLQKYSKIDLKIDYKIRNTIGAFNTSWDVGTPLMAACAYGCLPLLRFLLLDYQIDPSTDNNKAVRQAIRLGNPLCLSLLLQDPRVDPCGDYYCWASSNGQLNVFDILLYDSRISEAAEFSNSFMIQLAVKRNQFDVVKRLMQEVHVNLADNNQGAIHNALSGNFLDIVELLLQDSRVC